LHTAAHQETRKSRWHADEHRLSAAQWGAIIAPIDTIQPVDPAEAQTEIKARDAADGPKVVSSLVCGEADVLAIGQYGFLPVRSRWLVDGRAARSHPDATFGVFG